MKKNIEKISLENELNKRLNKDKLYYHCCECGFIFEDKNYNIGILNTKKFGIGKEGLPKVFEKYQISSGYCDHCYNKQIERREE